MSPQREVFLPFQHPPGRAPEVTRVRSTLLSASLQGIKQMGWEARYFAALPPALHDEMRLLTAGIWVPLSLGMEHYGACDRMQLTRDEEETMAKQVSLRTQKTFIGALGNVVSGAGATPWSMFQHTPRIWGRMIEGGDTLIEKLGPKDALVVVAGCPLLQIEYFRIGIRGYYSALVNLFTGTVHSRETPEHRSPTRIGMRFSWV